MSDFLGKNLVQVGRDAEDRAAQFLLGLGWTIVTRRFKARHGEIDIVALDGNDLVFVEVKHRRTEGYTPEESIGSSKLKALHRAIEEYLSESDSGERTFRLDVIAMDTKGLRHHRDILAP